jgi:hypothetical protein
MQYLDTAPVFLCQAIGQLASAIWRLIVNDENLQIGIPEQPLQEL